MLHEIGAASTIMQIGEGLEALGFQHCGETCYCLGQDVVVRVGSWDESAHFGERPEGCCPMVPAEMVEVLI